MNYLIDSCVVSDFLKKNDSTIERFKNLNARQIHISTISIMEIEYGIKINPERGTKIKPLWSNLLKFLQILPFTYSCSISASEIRSELKKLGLPIGPYDILIAGTAVANNMIMVTSNMREFNRVNGLVIENWRLK